MYVIQMADLHIGALNEDIEKEKEILAKGVKEIKSRIPTNQTVLVCICGDIIDSKGVTECENEIAAKRYEMAVPLIQLIKQELEAEYKLKLAFCPGNHDVTHFGEFTEFVQKFDADIKQDNLLGGYCIELEGICYVFLNSCAHAQYKFGCIDYSCLEQLLKTIPEEKPKIFVLHHTVLSMYPADTSAIRDSATLLEMIGRHNVIGVLHGHIHGSEHFLIGQKKCKIVGAGAFFSRNNTDVNSQFNVIEVGSFAIREISRYIYNADNRISGQSWCRISSEKSENDNYFQGGNFEEAYKNLLNELEYRKVLNSVVLHINCSYQEFNDNLNSFLQEDQLVLGEKRFSYSELADLWERTEVPKELYFNHGSYFKMKYTENENWVYVHGIEYVAKQLKEKPTSNKAVLTTYDMNTMVKMLNGEEYLPSLLSIQFSLSENGNIIYVHMYLRALEAGRFLKINICEIQWLLKRLKELCVSFSQVDIAISAFRVQKRERFNCFLKADLDAMSAMEIGYLVWEGRITDICKMLEEKSASSETITNNSGMKNLYDAMTMPQDDGKAYKYSDIVIELLEDVLEAYAKLDVIHKRGSIKTEDEIECEGKINKGITQIISELKKEKNGDTIVL